VILLFLACPAPPVEEVEELSCEAGPTLFGRPEAATGLSEAECGPACSCGGESWQAPEYTEADIAALRAWVHAEPFEPLLEDPYESPAEPAPEAVCGVLTEADGRYRLSSFEDQAALQAAGAALTHTGGCGLCSTLTDLAVYISVPDLTEPVRACGLEHLGSEPAELVACIEELGFTTPCAWIWAWNTLNTREHCLVECLAALEEPYNQPDGSLNPCLQCDEDISGPVFKAVAGRTRRNTGLPNAICRPCEDVVPLEHHY